jgi:hypothetical protein
MRLHKFGFIAKTVLYRSKKAAEGDLDSYRAVEDELNSAGNYDEEEDIDAQVGMTFDEMVQMLTLGLEDEPVVTSSVMQIDWTVDRPAFLHECKLCLMAA